MTEEEKVSFAGLIREYRGLHASGIIGRLLSTPEGRARLAASMTQPLRTAGYPARAKKVDPGIVGTEIIPPR